MDLQFAAPEEDKQEADESMEESIEVEDDEVADDQGDVSGGVVSSEKMIGADENLEDVSMLGKRPSNSSSDEGVVEGEGDARVNSIGDGDIVSDSINKPAVAGETATTSSAGRHSGKSSGKSRSGNRPKKRVTKRAAVQLSSCLKEFTYRESLEQLIVR